MSSTVSSKRRSWVTTSRVPSYDVERRFELLDGGQVEVVGGLVEHQAVHALRREAGEHGPRALAGRERACGARDVLRAEPELRQQRAGVGDQQPGGGKERVEQ